jgi:hypothetical protein
METNPESWSARQYTDSCAAPYDTLPLRILAQSVETSSWGGVRLSPVGMLVSIWPTVPVPDGRSVRSSRWNENWQGKSKHSEETCLSASSSTTNLIWPDLGSNPGRRGGKPTANRRSYGTARNSVTSDTTRPCINCWGYIARDVTWQYKGGRGYRRWLPPSQRILFFWQHSIGIGNYSDEGNDVNLQRVVIFVNVWREIYLFFLIVLSKVKQEVLGRIYHTFLWCDTDGISNNSSLPRERVYRTVA